MRSSFHCFDIFRRYILFYKGYTLRLVRILCFLRIYHKKQDLCRLEEPKFSFLSSIWQVEFTLCRILWCECLPWSVVKLAENLVGIFAAIFNECIEIVEVSECFGTPLRSNSLIVDKIVCFVVECHILKTFSDKQNFLSQVYWVERDHCQEQRGGSSIVVALADQTIPEQQISLSPGFWTFGCSLLVGHSPLKQYALLLSLALYQRGTGVERVFPWWTDSFVEEQQASSLLSSGKYLNWLMRHRGRDLGVLYNRSECDHYTQTQGNPEVVAPQVFYLSISYNPSHFQGKHKNT